MFSYFYNETKQKVCFFLYVFNHLLFIDPMMMMTKLLKKKNINNWLLFAGRLKPVFGVCALLYFQYVSGFHTYFRFCTQLHTYTNIPIDNFFSKRSQVVCVLCGYLSTPIPRRNAVLHV